MFDVPELTSGILCPLDRGVDGFQTSISDPVCRVGLDVREMTLDQLGCLGYWLQATMSGAPKPACKETLRRGQ